MLCSMLCSGEAPHSMLSFRTVVLDRLSKVSAYASVATDGI